MGARGRACVLAADTGLVEGCGDGYGSQKSGGDEGPGDVGASGIYDGPWCDVRVVEEGARGRCVRAVFGESRGAADQRERRSVSR